MKYNANSEPLRSPKLEASFNADDELKIVDNIHEPPDRESRSATEMDKSSVIEVLKSDELGHLSNNEKRILSQQLLMPDVNTSYTMLYRYATPLDILIIVMSVICSMASGAVMPLMTVNYCLVPMAEDTN
jgi:ATP-binding cassette subfamily B (MDR/TAP) protein 1